MQGIHEGSAMQNEGGGKIVLNECDEMISFKNDFGIERFSIKTKKLDENGTNFKSRIFYLSKQKF